MCVSNLCVMCIVVLMIGYVYPKESILIHINISISTVKWKFTAMSIKKISKNKESAVPDVQTRRILELGNNLTFLWRCNMVELIGTLRVLVHINCVYQ